MISLITLCVFVACVIFITNIQLSTNRLILLMFIGLISTLLHPALSSILGPGPARDANRKVLVGLDGQPLYTHESIKYWANVTATEDAMLYLGSILFLMALILLIIRPFLETKPNQAMQRTPFGRR